LRSEKILVAGAGGFIGGWVINNLLNQGYTDIRAVDIKPLSSWYQKNENVENRSLDLKDPVNTLTVTSKIHTVYNLAADMGGMGFIEKNKALCMMSVLINTNLLESSRLNGVDKYFFASSACVYNQSHQKDTNNRGLKESDAYPADPEDGYGWEKLFSERMCRHFGEDFGLRVRIARFHNVYGPLGTFDGGREKAPAAVCRKVAEAVISGSHEIQIWGDGEQTRSFTYIDDTVLGIQKLMDSSYSAPINLGSSQMVSINQLVDIVENIANLKLKRKYILDAPKGVRGRNSENTLIKEVLGWEPKITLEFGLDKTYKWIYDELSSGSKKSWH
jgi:nucleoside-diphosphate-sugar epimerase